MSLGRKKSSKKAEIKSPPPIRQVNFLSPTGSQFTSTRSGNTVTNKSNLDPLSQQTVANSLAGMSDISGLLATGDSQREGAIRQRATDLFNSNRLSINEASDLAQQQLSSHLSKRFGGSLSSTFGNELLARQEDNRARQLAQARQESDLLAEDLVRDDERSRMNRFALFQNYLADLNNQALGAQSQGSQLLSGEQSRAGMLAVQRASLLQRQFQDTARQDQQRREGVLKSFLSLASQLK